MERNERMVLIVSGSVMLVFLAALIYAAGGLGIGVPTCVDVRPFSEGKVIDKGNNHFEVHLVARMWAFDPAEIRLPAGADVDLYVSALDVTHGVYVAGTDVNLMAVPGSVNAARLRFDRPGTHAVICHEYCGIGHQFMAGRFVIGGSASAGVPPAAPAGR